MPGVQQAPRAKHTLIQHGSDKMFCRIASIEQQLSITYLWKKANKNIANTNNTTTHVPIV